MSRFIFPGLATPVLKIFEWLLTAHRKKPQIIYLQRLSNLVTTCLLFLYPKFWGLGRSPPYFVSGSASTSISPHCSYSPWNMCNLNPDLRLSLYPLKPVFFLPPLTSPSSRTTPSWSIPAYNTQPLSHTAFTPWTPLSGPSAPLFPPHLPGNLQPDSSLLTGRLTLPEKSPAGQPRTRTNPQFPAS